MAYRRFLEKKTANPDSQKKLTEMEEKIKMAEEEKEALRRKIAQLELASERRATHSNGTSEVKMSFLTLDQNARLILSLICPDSFGGHMFQISYSITSYMLIKG